MLIGLFILAAGALLLIPLENWVHRHLHGAWDFLAEHAYLPMARSAVIVLFLIAIYPTPMLHTELVPAAPGAINLRSLVNWMFLAGIALPLLPTMQKFGALIIPTQTLIGAWLLARSFAAEAGVTLQLNFEALGWFCGLAIASHHLLDGLARQLHNRQKLDALTAYDTLSLILLPWLVLIVTRSLVLT